MSNKFFAGVDDPWPFRHMEVGDMAVCLGKHTPNRAHAYGHATRKRFTVKRKTSKSGMSGFLVVRLPDDTPVQPLRGRPRGRLRQVWPYETLEVGQSYINNDPYEIPKVINSVNHTNTQHRKLRKRSTYAIRSFKNMELQYVQVIVTRVH